MAITIGLQTEELEFSGREGCKEKKKKSGRLAIGEELPKR